MRVASTPIALIRQEITRARVKTVSKGILLMGYVYLRHIVNRRTVILIFPSHFIYFIVRWHWRVFESTCVWKWCYLYKPWGRSSLRLSWRFRWGCPITDWLRRFWWMCPFAVWPRRSMCKYGWKFSLFVSGRASRKSDGSVQWYVYIEHIRWLLFVAQRFFKQTILFTRCKWMPRWTLWRKCNLYRHDW